MFFVFFVVYFFSVLCLFILGLVVWQGGWDLVGGGSFLFLFLAPFPSVVFIIFFSGFSCCGPFFRCLVISIWSSPLFSVVVVGGGVVFFLLCFSFSFWVGGVGG